MRRLLLLLVCLLFSSAATAQDTSHTIDISQTNVIAWSPTGQYLATGHYNGGLALWDGETGALVHQYFLTSAAHPDWTPYVGSLDWNPDGTRLVVGLGYPEENSVFQVLEMPSGKVLLDGIEGGRDLALDWSPDGTRLALHFVAGLGSWFPHEIRILDAGNGQLLQTLSQPLGTESGAVKWSPDSTKLATDIYTANGDWIADIGLTIWDISSGSEMLYFPHPTPLFSFEWSPDGGRIATASMDDVLRIWDTSTGQLRNSFKFDNSMWHISWHPSEDFLAVPYLNGSAIMNVNTGEILHEFSVSSGDVNWSPDGLRLATFLSTPLFFTFDGEVLPQFPAIVRYALVNTQTEKVIASVKDTTLIDLTTLENSKDLVVKASIPRFAPVQSIIFDLNGQQIIDNEAPFEIALPPPGDYTLTGIPYTELNGTGQVGTTLTVRFSVVEGSAGN